MIITIDGPAYAGKKTLARKLALTFDYCFIDAFAYYQALALLAEQQNIELDDPFGLAGLAKTISLNFEWDGMTNRVILTADQLRDRDITREIRRQEIIDAAAECCQWLRVADIFHKKQRDLATNQGAVAAGRLTGTQIFPEAEIKFFLTASWEARAFRRKIARIPIGTRFTPQAIQAEVEADTKLSLQTDHSLEYARQHRPAEAFDIDTTHGSPDDTYRLALTYILENFPTLAIVRQL